MYTAKEARVALAKVRLKELVPYVGINVQQAVEEGEGTVSIVFKQVDTDAVMAYLRQLGYHWGERSFTTVDEVFHKMKISW